MNRACRSDLLIAAKWKDDTIRQFEEAGIICQPNSFQDWTANVGIPKYFNPREHENLLQVNNTSVALFCTFQLLQ